MIVHQRDIYTGKDPDYEMKGTADPRVLYLQGGDFLGGPSSHCTLLSGKEEPRLGVKELGAHVPDAMSLLATFDFDHEDTACILKGIRLPEHYSVRLPEHYSAYCTGICT